MTARRLDWIDGLERWLAPFLARLGHKRRRRMCPLYVAGLIGPGDRKSVQPMADRLAPGEYDQLHHFVADAVCGCLFLILHVTEPYGIRSAKQGVLNRTLTPEQTRLHEFGFPSSHPIATRRERRRAQTVIDQPTILRVNVSAEDFTARRLGTRAQPGEGGF